MAFNVSFYFGHGTMLFPQCPSEEAFKNLPKETTMSEIVTEMWQTFLIRLKFLLYLYIVVVICLFILQMNILITYNFHFVHE